jgi:hypothetical protein
LGCRLEGRKRKSPEALRPRTAKVSVTPQVPEDKEA